MASVSGLVMESCDANFLPALLVEPLNLPKLPLPDLLCFSKSASLIEYQLHYPTDMMLLVMTELLLSKALGKAG